MHHYVRCALRSVALVAVAISGTAGQLPRSAPEEQGIASSALLKFVNALDTKIDGVHSVMVVRHGHVVAEGWWTPYNPESRHMLYSLSKSFASTAIGFAVAENKLSLDDTVISIFPDEAPAEPSANLKNMRVRDLLAMSTGHHNEDILRFNYSPDEGSAVKNFLALPVAHKPGTHFVYNTPASFMLSAIVQKKTGQNLVEYLQPRLFEPLDIKEPIWESNKQGINMGGFGLNIRTEEITKFGQLYLQNGKWNGKQLLPATWVAAATSRQTSNGSSPTSDWDQGYGYQFWRCRHNAYRGDGAFGQYCIVLPEHDAVVAITSGVKDMQSVMNVVWDSLLPAFKSNTLPADCSARDALSARLASLRLPIPEGVPTNPNLKKSKFVFESNPQKFESITLTESTLECRIDGADRSLPYSPKQWSKTEFGAGPLKVQPAYASGGWKSDTLTVKVAFVETPYILTMRLNPTGDKLIVDQELNVSFGPTKLPQMTGRAELP